MYTTESEAQQALVQLYTLFVAISILLYDHMATLPEEIMIIWCRPKATFAVLFLVNRYIAVLSNILDLMSTFLPVSIERFQLCFFNIYYLTHQRLSCRKFVVAVYALRIFQQVFICFTLTLRTYALYGCRRHLPIWMGIIVLAVVTGILLVGVFRYNLVNGGIGGGSCYKIYTTSVSIRYGIAWIVMFIYELLIFILTVSRTWKTRGLRRFSLISRRDILDVIFHDGVMYFAGMTLVNLPNILTYFCGPEILRGSLSAFTTCLFILHTRTLLLPCVIHVSY
ncbi:uncharacterized protein F5891DRAFT_559182 [Suillus fuscotomentosus]|uniref:DUF6533 domain-containing protein n=1 Tax=Suillus fuscotomentosus TaxID=1912939 RepID=A0AAD4EHM1_9AGAM|nr:uncharacterized protein F5891DRAFT_559182 [Suillus fuscotomentosus]KAG1906307.1 hypothetical protein F5891DRAFT_559182 [Suillus fuscotomentosus]